MQVGTIIKGRDEGMVNKEFCPMNTFVFDKYFPAIPPAHR